jgi:ribosome-associated protein
MEPREIAKPAAEALSNKKAQDLRVLEMTDLTIIADFFIIATGTSATHLRTLAEEAEHSLKQQGITPSHKEGRNSGNWLLMDYDSVVLHLFLKDTRAFYDIERLWSDSKEWKPEEL